MSDMRVLCLHGYHGSAAILRDQMESLTARLPANIEFVYVNAPSLATGGFGWWHEGFDGWERTRDWAIELVCAGPRFDGIFGFSQGAALAGLLTAVQESGSAPPEFRFDFAVMAGGFTSDLPQHADLLRHRLTTPSAHVIGRTDVIVPRKDSLRLASRFADPLIIKHSGGHVVPGHLAVAGPIAVSSPPRRKQHNEQHGESESRSPGDGPRAHPCRHGENDLVPRTWPRCAPWLCSATVRPPGWRQRTCRHSPPTCPATGSPLP